MNDKANEALAEVSARLHELRRENRALWDRTPTINPAGNGYCSGIEHALDLAMKIVANLILRKEPEDPAPVSGIITTREEAIASFMPAAREATLEIFRTAVRRIHPTAQFVVSLTVTGVCIGGIGDGPHRWLAYEQDESAAWLMAWTFIALERELAKAKVGYGKPPKEHRFKPGQSGNPNGRPKAQRKYKVAVTEVKPKKKAGRK